MLPPIPYTDAVEVIPTDEAEDIAQILEILRSTLQIHLEKTGQRLRDVHAKAHGSARGQFFVLPNLAPELAQGLFAEQAVFPAVVRFSNAAPWLQPDVVPDGRGLAIQVEYVPGSSQDFVMVNHPTFIAKNVKDYRHLEEARLKAGDNPFLLAAILAAGAWNPAHWKEAFAAAATAGHPPAHPASFTYYSMTPIRYGDNVAKYRIKPADAVRQSFLEVATRLGTERDALSHLLRETLLLRELMFEFQVQLRTSADAMPVEDATVNWPEELSPFQTVATLVLPVQDIDVISPQLEGRAYSVWNALEAHRPLGGINRSRQFVYQASARFRQ
jgi:catalase